MSSGGGLGESESRGMWKAAGKEFEVTFQEQHVEPRETIRRPVGVIRVVRVSMLVGFAQSASLGHGLTSLMP